MYADWLGHLYLSKDSSLDGIAKFIGLECGDCDLERMLCSVTQNTLNTWQKLELMIASCINCNHGSCWDLSRESPCG